MNTFVKGLLITTLGLGMALPAAADASSRLKGKGHELDNRIEQGVRSGELTRKEARSLRGEKRELRHIRRDYLRDGRLSKRERQALAKARKRLSKRVYRLKHNDRRDRYGYRPRYQQHRSYPFFGRNYYDQNRDRRHHYRHDYSYDYRHDYSQYRRDHRRHWH